MFAHLSLLAEDLKCIFSGSRGLRRPLRLLLTHCRLKLKQKFFEFLGVKKTQEKFLGLTVFFSDYGWFCNMWRETFVSEMYYFKSDNDAPRIVDVGSNIGMTICYFKLLYPKSEIVGIEPEPEAFALLKKTIEANGFHGVVIKNVAVSAKGGTIAFYQDTFITASGIGTTVDNFLPLDRQKKIEVPSMRLSQLIKGRVDLLKVCAEGVEHEILEEADQELHLVSRIFTLVHQRGGERNENIPKLLGLLEKNGFRYAITSTRISHGDFIEKSVQAYAFTLDAERARGGK